jgi:hypothetical protein
MKLRNNTPSGEGAPQTVYVVTRDRRRTSDWNFSKESDARDEAQYWINICRQYDPKSKVSIVKTDKPRKIR